MWGFKASGTATLPSSTSSTTMTPPRANISPTKDPPQQQTVQALVEQHNSQNAALTGAGVAAPPPAQSPFRPRHQQDELEALRQRGLAKLLNKHFTETTAKLAAEKAAVDAALKDLEDRKKKTSSNNSTTSSRASRRSNSSKQNNSQSLILQDDMYHRIHRMKTECRQKEKETLLLYQRYVHKFGFTGQIKPPKEHRPKPPAAPAKTTLPPLAEDIAAAKQQPSVAADAPPRSVLSSTKLSSLPEFQEEGTLPASSSSAQERALLKTPAAILPAYSEDDEDGADDSEDVALLKKYLPNNNAEAEEAGVLDDLSKADDVDRDDDDDDDLSSLISGLTSVDSATTRQILLDCEMTVATFLDEERKAIQHLMDEDSQKHHSSPSSSRQGSMADAEESESVLQAESMAQQMEQILLDYQQQLASNKAVVGGGTAGTAQANDNKASPGDDSLTSATTFSGAASPSTTNSQQQQQHPRPYPTSNPNEEWTVLWDETYQREYYHEAKSGLTQWHAPSLVNTTMSSSSVVSEDPDFDPLDVMPDASLTDPSQIEIMNNNNNRILKYRAKRRRRRRKQILRVATVVLTCLGAYYYFRYYRNRSNNNSSTTTATMPEINDGVECEEEGAPLSAISKAEVSKEEEEEKPIEFEPVAEEQQVEEEKKPSSSSWDTRVTEPAQALVDPNDLDCVEYDDDEYNEDDLAAAAANGLVLPGRPAGCNIPLAHVVSKKCRVLAKEQPVFDLNGLVQTMMQ